MKSSAWCLALVLILPNFSLAANDTQSVPIAEVKKTVVLEGVAKDAYLWGYPLVRFERTKKLMTTTSGYGHAPLNHFFHATRPLTAQDRNVANPLPDTLYSSAFLDLRDQPLVLQTPKIKDRYYSLQVYDAFDTNLFIISSRTRGESPGKFFVTGPHYIGSTPVGFEHIRVPTNFAWINGRIEATSPDQVKSSYKLIRKYDLKPYAVYLRKQKLAKAPLLKAPMTAEMDPRLIANAGIGFFDELGVALRENEPADLNSAMMARFRNVNIGAGVRTSRFVTNPENRDSYTRAIAAAEIDMDRSIKKDLVARRNGWNYILSYDKNVLANPIMRAALSKIYFGQSNPVESVHPVTYIDADNIRLNGNTTYILRFAKGTLPPVGAFWSVAPYNARQKSLVANNLNRYAIGSYSKNLVYNPDGSLDIYISANEPRGMTQNWLPVPRSNFYVMMNMYNPTTDILQGKYFLPRVQRMNLSPVLSLNK